MNKAFTGLERHGGKWLMTIFFILGWSNPLEPYSIGKSWFVVIKLILVLTVAKIKCIKGFTQYLNFDHRKKANPSHDNNPFDQSYNSNISLLQTG